MIIGVDDNPYLTTASGLKFHLLSPSPLEVTLFDIATALSRAPRFAGHTISRWSVAEHSMLVAYILRTQGYNAKLQMAGLLHDAAEAYLCDVPAPLKWAMEDGEGLLCTYRRIEQKVEHAIDSALQPDWLTAPDYARKAVKQADLIALVTEQRDLMPGTEHTWTEQKAEPLPIHPFAALDDYLVRLCVQRGWTVSDRFLSAYDSLLDEITNPS